MSEYRRMVSYFYRYDNGVKQNNVGFARVESRQDILKLTIELNDAKSVKEVQYDVNFYRYEKGEIQLVKVGEAEFVEDMLYFQTKSKEGDIGQSGYGLNDFSGLIVYYNDQIFYGSQWDEKPIKLRIKKEERKVESGLEQRMDRNEGSTMQPRMIQPQNEMRERNSQQITTPEPSMSQPNVVEPNVPQSNLSEPNASQPNIPRSNVPQSNLSEPNTSQSNIPRSNVPQSNLSQPNTLEPNLSQPNYLQDTPNSQRPIMQGPDEMESQSDVADFIEQVNLSLEEKAMQEEKINAKIEPEAEPITENFAKQQNDEKRNNGISYLLKHRSPLPDFGNHEVFQCVRILPEDIGLLERDNWDYGNNSFVMHGYYNYRYLLLGCMQYENGQKQYILGVPGIFSNKDKYLAQIFGFKEFLPLRICPYKTGEFGYWIGKIKE